MENDFNADKEQQYIIHMMNKVTSVVHKTSSSISYIQSSKSNNIIEYRLSSYFILANCKFK